MQKIKMILFSDVHYGNPSGGVHKGVQRKLPQYAVPLTEKLIKRINEINPDVVINLGDSIDDVKDYDEDVVFLKHILKVMQAIKPPFYPIAGNHDIQTIKRFEVAKHMGYDRPSFSFDLNGYHFILLGIDSVVDTATKRRIINADDLAWLEQDIKKNNLPSLVFLHHGIAEDNMKGNWWFEENPEGGLLYNRNELKKILKTDKNLLAVFSGHQHWTKSIVEDGISYHIIGSLTENIKGDGVPDGVWFEVDIKGKQLKLKKHHLDLEGK